MSPAPLEELRMLTRVARLYHTEGLRQADVAQRVGLSQPGVSRALRRASGLGIVRTVVVAPAGVFPGLEDDLRTRYGLHEAVVVEAGGGNVTPALGAATATYLATTLKPGERIGVASWSSTLMAATDALPPRTTVRAASVSQLLGGLGSPGVQFRLTERVAEATGARAELLPAPGLLERASVRGALVRDPAVANVLGGYEELTLALVGVGGLAPSRPLEHSGNAIDAVDAEQLTAAGAVGEICLRFFDADGRAVRSDVDRRVLAISPETLRAVPRRIGVAGGARKLQALRGALRGGWINVQITDIASARRLARETP